MRTSRLILALPALLLVAAAACDRETPEQRSARRDARRTACVADELALQAKERLAKLDTVLAISRGSPTEQLTAAGYRFAFALKEHADSAARVAAYTDSAVHARASEDSLRYAQAAEKARPPAPQPNTVEANAAERYRRDMAAALGNLDHPCNKEEGEES